MTNLDETKDKKNELYNAVTADNNLVSFGNVGAVQSDDTVFFKVCNQLFVVDKFAKSCNLFAACSKVVCHIYRTFYTKAET